MEIKIDIPKRYVIIADHLQEDGDDHIDCLIARYNHTGDGHDYGESLLGRKCLKGGYYSYEFSRWHCDFAVVFERKIDAEKALEIFAKKKSENVPIQVASPIGKWYRNVRIVTLEDAINIFIKQDDYRQMPNFPLRVTTPRLA